MSADDVIHDLEDELLDMGRRYRIRIREAAKALHPKLDPASYPLISMLAKRGPMRLSELATHLLAEKSTLSRQVDAAVRLGLVERIPDPDDARARQIALTPEGQQGVSAQLQARREQLHERLRGWPESEIRELTRLMRRLNQESP
ncbi:MAG: MarR family winged helix-turn-helix transcriptional regulator [Stackebrandtia sp.]